MTTTQQSEVTHRWMPWLVCFSASLFFFYELIQGNMFASINHEVMQSFNIGIIKNGWLSSIYYLSNVLFLFPASLVLDRYRTKFIILSAMAVCVFGTLLFAVAQSFYLALICRFLTGIGSAFCFLSCIRLASRWFPSEKMAFVTGTIVTIAMFGGIVAQTPLTLLVTHFGWRQALLLDGLLGIVLMMWIYVFVKDFPNKEQEMAATHNGLTRLSYWQSLRYAYSNFQNILAALYTSLMNMPIALLGAYIGSTYLTEAYHFPRTQASSINGMIFLGMIIGCPLIGAWSDKIRLRRMPMLLCTVLSMFVVVFILYMPKPTFMSMEFLFFLLGFFSSGQIISYALVTESVPLSMTATCVGVISVFSQSGFLIYQNLFSYLYEAQQSSVQLHSTIPHLYQHSLMLIPYGFVIAMLCAICIRETHGHRADGKES